MGLGKVRRAKRFSGDWSVRVKTRGVNEVHTLRTLNVSRTGAFVRTTRQLSVGTQLELTFAELGSTDFVLIGEVVRVATAEEGPAGIGVAFKNVGTSTRDRLARMIQHSGDGTSLEASDGSHSQTSVVAASVAMDPATAFKRAVRLRATGRSAHALEIADALVQCFPDRDDFKVFHHLTVAALANDSGERDTASMHWEAALRLDPHNPEARAATGATAGTGEKPSGLSKLMRRFRGG